MWGERQGTQEQAGQGQDTGGGEGQDEGQDPRQGPRGQGWRAGGGSLRQDAGGGASCLQAKGGRLRRRCARQLRRGGARGGDPGSQARWGYREAQVARRHAGRQAVQGEGRGGAQGQDGWGRERGPHRAGERGSTQKAQAAGAGDPGGPCRGAGRGRQGGSLQKGGIIVSLRKRPVYMIGIASELIGVHPQTLRMYEQKGLLRPRKSIKNTRLYSQEDVDLGRYIQLLTQELGMNLAGVSKVLDLERQVAELERENRALREELERKELEHRRLIAEVHRSYKRELVLMPRSELARSGRKGRK